MKLRKTRGAVFNITLHFVFVTKYRRKVFSEEHITFLGECFEKICEDFNCDLVEFNGEADHAHLLINIVPKTSAAKLANSLKGVASRHIRKQYPHLKEKFYGKEVLWSPSYFVCSTGGAPLEIIKQYIQQQEGGLSSHA